MKAKKLRRQYRKILGEQMEDFESYLKPKPKWLPGFLWRKLAGMVIKMEKVNKNT